MKRDCRYCVHCRDPIEEPHDVHSKGRKDIMYCSMISSDVMVSIGECSQYKSDSLDEILGLI